MFKLGEVKIPTEEDFDYIRNLCENEEGWNIENNKKNYKIYSRINDKSPFKMIRAKGEFQVSAKCFYDAVQDSEYCDKWDDRKDKSIDICRIVDNSDIIYYSIKFPKPFKNRDFVVQRCWKDYGENREKMIFNHSVNHAKYPPKPGFIRGISYITATLIVPTSANSCKFCFVTQLDPGGLPVWAVNISSKFYGPKFVEKVKKACLKYDKWKSTHNPDYMPWIYPEQIRSPMIDWNDILQFNAEDLKKVIIDESNIDENEVKLEEDSNEIEEN